MLQRLVDSLDALHDLAPYLVDADAVVGFRVHFHCLEPHQTGLDSLHIGEVFEHLRRKDLHLKEVGVALASFPIHDHSIVAIQYKYV